MVERWTRKTRKTGMKLIEVRIRWEVDMLIIVDDDTMVYYCI
jgi:hypothetical protein